MGGCFWKKSGKWGVFCNKVENGEVFFVKKVDLSSTQGALCTVSIFFILHFTYLGVRTHPTHPLCLRARGFRQTLAGTRAEGVSRVSSYYYKHYP